MLVQNRSTFDVVDLRRFPSGPLHLGYVLKGWRTELRRAFRRTVDRDPAGPTSGSACRFFRISKPGKPGTKCGESWWPPLVHHRQTAFLRRPSYWFKFRSAFVRTGHGPVLSRWFDERFSCDFFGTRLFACALIAVTCGFCLETKLLAPDELNKRVRKYPVAWQTADFSEAQAGKMACVGCAGATNGSAERCGLHRWYG